MSFFDNFLNTFWMIIGWILSMWVKGECSWMNFMHDGIGSGFSNDCGDNHCWWIILRCHPWHFQFVGLTTFVLQNVSSSFISSKKLYLSNSFCVYAPKQPTNVTIKQKMQIVRTWNSYLQDLVLGCWTIELHQWVGRVVERWIDFASCHSLLYAWILQATYGWDSPGRTKVLPTIVQIP